MNRSISAVCSRPRTSSSHRAAVRGWTVASVLAVALLGPSVARAGGPAISDDARAKFNVGVTLLTDPEGPRYEEAYLAFKAAYASSPSSKILGNLGLCAMKLERDDEAIAAYEKYLADGKDLARAEQAQVTADLATLKAAVAHVTIETDPPGAEIFDVRIPVRGERVLNDYGTVAAPTKLGLHQGTHQLTARLEGYPDQTWDVDIVGGQDLPPHKFVFTKEAAPQAPVPLSQAPVSAPLAPVATSRPVPTSVWIGVAAAGAFTAATVVTGVLAMGKHNDFETANSGQNPQNAQSIKSSGQTMNLVSDICLGGAVVAAGVTAVLYLARPTVTSESAHAQNERTLVVSPEIGRSSAGLGLKGSF
jgi:hypothetical protein